MKAGWEVKSLAEVAITTNGGTPKSGTTEFWGGNVEWLTPKDMGKLESEFISETPRKISELGLSKCSAKLVPKNSVIMSTRAPIGHLAINTVPMAFNQGCRGLTPTGVLETKFLFYYLGANIPELNDLGTGATFKELSSGALKSFSIPLPPLDEQKRIVAVLDAAFNGLARARANVEANLKNAREVFESYLHQEINSLAVKAGWEVVPLDKCLDKFSVAAKIPKKQFLEQGAFPVISQEADFVNGYWNNVEDVCHVDQPVIVFGDHTQVLKYVDFNFVIGADGVKILKPKDLLNAKFLKYFIQANPFPSLGYARHYRHVKNLEVPLPPLDEQKRIIAILDAALNRVKQIEAHNQSKLADLDELRQSLLQKAFAGELT